MKYLKPLSAIALGAVAMSQGHYALAGFLTTACLVLGGDK